MTNLDNITQDNSISQQDQVATLRTRMDHALRIWSMDGWDSVAGGFVERLDGHGKADLAAPRRVRVQAPLDQHAGEPPGRRLSTDDGQTRDPPAFCLSRRLR